MLLRRRLRLRELKARKAPSSMRLRLKPLDWLVLAACSALVAFSAASVYSGGDSELRVVVNGEGGEEWIYPLDKDREIPVQGPLGTTLVEIHEGHVHIADSPCPNKTCVAAGSVSLPGQWVACLPNSVFVRVEGSSSDDAVDAGAY